MIKFCPMCGQKITSGSRFCNGCGLNLVEYQQKLDKLLASDKNESARAKADVSAKEIATQPCLQGDSNSSFNLQDYICSLTEKYTTLPKVYFNVENKKNKTKISAACKAYAREAISENVIFVFDDTLFGAADDGFLVTDKKVYVHNMNEDPFKISLAEINSCSIKKALLERRIVLNGNAEIQLTSYDRLEAEKMRDLLKEIRATFCGQATVDPKKHSLLCREEKTSPAQPISQETPRDVELTEEFAYYAPPPPFTTPPPKNFWGKPYIIKNETECRTEDQQYMLKSFKQAIYDLSTHEYDDSPTIKSVIQESALSSIESAAHEGYMPAIYLLGHFYLNGYMVEKDLVMAKHYFEDVVAYGEDENDKMSQRLIALGIFSTIMRHDPSMRARILKPEVFHYYLRELMETSLASNYPLKCVYFNTAHCDLKTLKKINSALEVYVGQLKEFEFPLIVFDPTTFGSAIEGCLFSNFGIYIRNTDEKTTHFVDYESYETKDITIRGLILKDVYVGEQKIETSSCGYSDSERTTFAYIVRDMGSVFGKR